MPMAPNKEPQAIADTIAPRQKTMQQGQPNTAGQGDAGFGDRFNQWMGWFGTPAGRASLLQFGVTMLQPHRGGFFGALGTSLGAGAAAGGRVLTAEQQAAAQAAELAREQQQQNIENELAGRRVGAAEKTAEASMIRAKKPSGGGGKTNKQKEEEYWMDLLLKDAAGVQDYGVDATQVPYLAESLADLVASGEISRSDVARVMADETKRQQLYDELGIIHEASPSNDSGGLFSNWF